MVELWRRLIGHTGTFLAELELWDTSRAPKARPIQSGYRACWSFEGLRQFELPEGPIDLVGDRRSLKPGEQGLVLIHPLIPAFWVNVQPGSVLRLFSSTAHPRETGRATVLERRNVPLDAPLRLEVVDKPGRTFLTRAEDHTQDER